MSQTTKIPRTSTEPEDLMNVLNSNPKVPKSGLISEYAANEKPVIVRMKSDLKRTIDHVGALIELVSWLVTS